jgi:hypothetical protein
MRSHLSLPILVLLWCLPAKASDLPAAEAEPPETIIVIVGTREPQSIRWTTTLTIWDVIKHTGTTYFWTTPRKFRLTRGGERMMWDIRKIQRGEIPHPKLQPGDSIELPSNQTQ